jgi:hypothetical protein
MVADIWGIRRSAYNGSMEYLTRLPQTIPADRALVHNTVRPTRRLGSRGLRAWLHPLDETLEICDCGWAGELGRHYRVAIIAPPVAPVSRWNT